MWTAPSRSMDAYLQLQAATNFAVEVRQTRSFSYPRGCFAFIPHMPRSPHTTRFYPLASLITTAPIT